MIMMQCTLATIVFCNLKRVRASWTVVCDPSKTWRARQSVVKLFSMEIFTIMSDREKSFMA